MVTPHMMIEPQKLKELENKRNIKLAFSILSFFCNISPYLFHDHPAWQNKQDSSAMKYSSCKLAWGSFSACASSCANDTVTALE